IFPATSSNASSCSSPIHSTTSSASLFTPITFLFSSLTSPQPPSRPLGRGRSLSHFTAEMCSPQASKTAPHVDDYFKQVDDSTDHFIDRLRRAVAMPSISADEARRPDVVRMGEWLADELKALGAEVELRPLGEQPGKPGLDLPPVVLAR